VEIGSNPGPLTLRAFCDARAERAEAALAEAREVIRFFQYPKFGQETF
jgi:hypothetical protein